MCIEFGHALLCFFERVEITEHWKEKAVALTGGMATEPTERKRSSLMRESKFHCVFQSNSRMLNAVEEKTALITLKL